MGAAVLRPCTVHYVSHNWLYCADNKLPSSGGNPLELEKLQVVGKTGQLIGNLQTKWKAVDSIGLLLNLILLDRWLLIRLEICARHTKCSSRHWDVSCTRLLSLPMPAWKCKRVAMPRSVARQTSSLGSLKERTLLAPQWRLKLDPSKSPSRRLSLGCPFVSASLSPYCVPQ